MPQSRLPPMFLVASLLIASACTRATVPVLSESDSSFNEAPFQGTATIVLEHDGLERSYVLHAPALERPAALVMSLHGGGGRAETEMAASRLLDYADERGFVLVVPNGTRADPSRPARFSTNPQSWNDGSGRGGVGAVERGVDDVGFLSHVIEDVGRRVPVDPERVYVTGFSNGASMSFRLARELPGRFAALAPVSGEDWSREPVSDLQVSMAYITGDSDPLNPVEGGEITLGGRSYGTKQPTAELVERWREGLDCPADPSASSDDGQVQASTWSPCRGEKRVELRILVGHGHHWPGSVTQVPRFIAGPNATDFQATPFILDFFDGVAGL